MAYKVYADLTEEEQAIFTAFEWHKGKIAYDSEKERILLRSKATLDKRQQNRYYIWPVEEKADCYTSFLAKDDADAIIRAPWQRKKAAKKPEPKLDEIVKPDFKIKVKNVYYNFMMREYTLVHLDIEDGDVYSDVKEVRTPIKRALATLRKAVQAYRHSPLYKSYHTGDDWQLNTGGDLWKLPEEIVFYFADWFEFSAPLEDLLQQAKKKAQNRWKQEREEEERRRQSYGYNWNWSTGGYSYSHGGSGSHNFFGLGGIGPELAYNNALTTLGLTSASLTVDLVKRTYKRLALRTHPDVGGDPAKFREVNDAYNLVLRRLQASA
jgi:hypothetical protein